MSMNRQQLIQFKLQPALAECLLHRKRLQQAWQEAVHFAVFNQASTLSFNDDEVRTLDQLVFRFGRLQDSIGTRLLPALLQVIEEWHDHEPFLDKLNRAEKLGLLPSAEQWQLLRELRNQTAHEYPNQPRLVVDNLHRLVQHVPALDRAFQQLAAAAQQRMDGASGPM